MNLMTAQRITHAKRRSRQTHANFLARHLERKEQGTAGRNGTPLASHTHTIPGLALLPSAGRVALSAEQPPRGKSTDLLPASCLLDFAVAQELGLGSGHPASPLLPLPTLTPLPPCPRGPPPGPYSRSELLHLNLSDSCVSGLAAYPWRTGHRQRILDLALLSAAGSNSLVPSIPLRPSASGTRLPPSCYCRPPRPKELWGPACPDAMAPPTAPTPGVPSIPDLPNGGCSNITLLREDGDPVVSSLMFAAGVVGNVAALAILGVHRKELRTKTSSFAILVTGLALTDLLGTCFLSPVVFVAYSRNATLLGMAEGGELLCDLFAFAMMFFSLARHDDPVRYGGGSGAWAISCPYFYSQHNIRRWTKASLPFIYALSTFFCALPFLGFGKYKQYCPGTWCFVYMDKRHDAAFSLSYATFMALLILAIFLCNALVSVSLCQMYLKQKARRRGSVNVAQRRRKSWFSRGEEEVDHLVLLALMTVIFVICSLPLTIRAYIGGISPDGQETQDMLAFRLSALNPIVDPWLFIIFRNSVFRSMRDFFCCRLGWFSLPSRRKASDKVGMREGLSFQDNCV
ncbi:LOW QUALITY PROTEIN: prostacyclin receptor [Heteronotia binoei]|uniref:LOW QUALITY PROTEIN: prostacyclin receptor n=1 Tax=Heteronotia binoei TaxID=13085 RepID=UPI00292D49D7|nr:LOW QUALITY PROTEIN: prostacyclin receptor [Heteronotia binoei]